MNFYEVIDRRRTIQDFEDAPIDDTVLERIIGALSGGDRVKIIALSANAFEEDIQKSLSIGMNAHVAKPIDVNILFETMKNLAG